MATPPPGPIGAPADGRGLAHWTRNGRGAPRLVAGPSRARIAGPVWPKDAAVALVSHTMKQDS